LGKRIYDELSTLQQKTGETVKRVVETTTETIKSGAESVIGTLQAVPALAMQPVLSLFSLIPPVSFSSFKGRRVRKLVKVIIRKLGDAMGSGLHWAASKLASLKSVLKKKSIEYFHAISKRALSLLDVLKKALLIALAVLQGGALLARLILAWVLALIR